MAYSVGGRPRVEGRACGRILCHVRHPGALARGEGIPEPGKVPRSICTGSSRSGVRGP